jgi:small subunit ribosomal protein S6
MPFYELVYTARQDLSASEVNVLTESFETILKKNGGRIASREYWGLRTLAYPIKKNLRGHYVLLNIDSQYPAVKELERIMGFNENILRKGIFKLEALPSEPNELAVTFNGKEVVRDAKDGKK